VRALDFQEDVLKHRLSAVARPIDPRVIRVVDGLKDLTLNQWPHAFLPDSLAYSHPVVSFAGGETDQVARVAADDLPG
jgi:hypothetical protein